VLSGGFDCCFLVDAETHHRLGDKICAQKIESNDTAAGHGPPEWQLRKRAHGQQPGRRQEIPQPHPDPGLNPRRSRGQIVHSCPEPHFTRLNQGTREPGDHNHHRSEPRAPQHRPRPAITPGPGPPPTGHPEMIAPPWMFGRSRVFGASMATLQGRRRFGPIWRNNTPEGLPVYPRLSHCGVLPQTSWKKTKKKKKILKKNKLECLASKSYVWPGQALTNLSSTLTQGQGTLIALSQQSRQTDSNPGRRLSCAEFSPFAPQAFPAGEGGTGAAIQSGLDGGRRWPGLFQGVPLGPQARNQGGTSPPVFLLGAVPGTRPGR